MTRARLALAIAALSVAAFVFALVLVHHGGHQTLQGSVTDPTDPDALAVDTQVEVECASAARGPLLTDDGGTTAPDEPKGAVAEDNGFELSRNQGIDTAQVSAVCGRIRTERLTHAVELAFLGLLLAGSALGVKKGRTWDPVDRTPSPTRDDGAVL